MSSPQHVLVRRSLSSHIGAAGPPNSGGPLSASLANPFGFGFDDGVRSVPSQAREYVESLHQNQWDSLLYGEWISINKLWVYKYEIHTLPS